MQAGIRKSNIYTLLKYNKLEIWRSIAVNEGEYRT